MKENVRLLLVEDSMDDQDLLLLALRRGGYEPHYRRVDTAAAMADALNRESWDLVIADYSLPQFSGLQALDHVQARGLDIPFIIVSGTIGEEVAVAAMKAGAHDYVMKHNLRRLLPAIGRELREHRVRQAKRKVEQELEENAARLRAIVSNLPGVVFQLLSNAPGDDRFSYASAGSDALLGISSRELESDAERFFRMIDPHDLRRLRFGLANSADENRQLDWEGHIGRSEDGTRRWISVRCSPRRLDHGGVLWEGIISDITAAKLAAEEVRESRVRLSELTSHLETVKEQERARIAREIHDDVGGNLTAIKIDVLSLGTRLAQASAADHQKIRALEGLIDATMDIASRIARDLRPGILDFGLLPALEWQAAEFSARMEIPCSVKCPNQDSEVEPGLATALFSIFRETLTNIAKHAGARRVDVDLRVTPHEVRLIVSDDGCGVKATDLYKAGSFGLRGMQERVMQLRGEFSVTGAPESGTHVQVRLPRSAGPVATQPASRPAAA